ncbi:MAG: hydroxymethylbilane synthase [Verrucomicrobiota bacterium]
MNIARCMSEAGGAVGVSSSLVIGTRGSDLALVQAEAVQSALEASESMERRVERRIIKTTGDKRQDIRLSEIGGKAVDKGVFTKELEEALLAGEVDAAVHSLKDVPTEMDDRFVIAGVLPRAAVEDVLLMRSAGGLEELEEGAVVATSSLRRLRQLKFLRRDLEIVEIRGNVPTRIRKLMSGELGYDAIMLARAGLERLGYGGLESGALEFEGERIGVEVMDAKRFLPAAGQGIVGIETRAGDEETRVDIGGIGDGPAMVQARAERAFLECLQAGCQTPVGVHSWVTGDRLWMRSRVFDEADADGSAGTAPKSGEAVGSVMEPEAVAAALFESLREE